MSSALTVGEREVKGVGEGGGERQGGGVGEGERYRLTDTIISKW